jgi:hypothetical protein
MTLTEQVIRNITYRVITNQDYRIEIVNLLNASFLEFSVDFIKQIIKAKSTNQPLTKDWYLSFFANTDNFSTKDIAIHLGLNKKTIVNMYKKAPKNIVLEASLNNYENLVQLIDNLAMTHQDLSMSVVMQDGKQQITLSLEENLLVQNILAVKRATLRGSLWALAGKRVEKVLMQTLCKLYEVSAQNFSTQPLSTNSKGTTKREVDFYLIAQSNFYPVEVKLMGTGNPEKVDEPIARGVTVLVADTLNAQNRKLLDEKNILFVELRSKEGYKQFAKVLQHLHIPYQPFEGVVDKRVEEILTENF